MKGFSICKVASLAALAFGLAFLTACGDDDSFSPVAKNRGYDYAYTSAKDLSKTPCNEMREGREAVVGREKDLYECRFDRVDSVYIWVGDYDTLTAEGREFKRQESSSSEKSSSSRGDGGSETAMTSSSSRYSSSSEMYSSGYSSSSSFPTSFSSMAIPFSVDSKEEFFNPSVDYGTLIDERDGKTYKTVIVGERVWMAENLNFADFDAYPILEGHSFCFNNEDANCDLMGRLYDRAAAMNSAGCDFKKYCDLGDSLVRGVCPAGWHIPTEQEAKDLLAFFKADFFAAISTKGWKSSIVGNNASGFSLVASGNLSGDRFAHIGELAMVWYYVANTTQWYLVLEQGRPHLQDYTSEKEYVSIRCVSDEAAPSSSSVSSSSAESSSSALRDISSYKFDLDTNYYSVESKEVFFNPDIDYGEMTDPRDGQKYKTIEVNGVVWMAENLRYADSSEYPLLKGESLCYNNDNDNCELLGRLYSRRAAMNDERCAYRENCFLGKDHVQGICPEGWHIPNVVESGNLLILVNENAVELRSIQGWKAKAQEDEDAPGEDTYGLSFAPSGNYTSAGYFGNRGSTSFTWVYNESKEQYYLLINGSQKLRPQVTNFSAYELFMSVRCVMD